MIPYKFSGFLVLCFAFQLQLHSQVNHVYIVDSIYLGRDYNEALIYSEKQLQEVDNISHYQRIGLHYYAALSNYRLNNFTSSHEIIHQAYDQINVLNPLDSLQARMIVDICQRVGDYSFMTEDFGQGIEAMEKGLYVLENHLSNDYWRTIKLLHKNGAVLRVQGSLSKSKAQLDRALILVDSLPEASRAKIKPAVKSEIAGWYNFNHQPKKAIKVYNELIVEAEKDSNYRRMDIYNNNISNSYKRLNDYGKALYHLHKSLKAKNKAFPEHHPKKIAVYGNLAKLYVDLDDLENAEKYWQKTEFLIKNNLAEDLQMRLTDLEVTKGKAYLKKKQYEKALAHFLKQGKEANHAQNINISQKAEVYSLIGYTYGKLYETALAKEYIFKEIKLRKAMELEEDYELASAYLYLCNLYTLDGKDADADLYLNKAFRVINLNINDPDAINKAASPADMVPFLQNKILTIARKIGKGESVSIQDGQQYVAKAEELMQELRFMIDDFESTSILHKDLQPLHEAIVSFYISAFKLTNDPQYLAFIFKREEKSNNTFLYQHLAENASEKFGISNEVIHKKNRLITAFNDQKEIVNTFKVESEIDKNVYAKALEHLSAKKELLYLHMNEIDSLFPQYYQQVYNYPIADLNEIQESLKQGETILQYVNSMDKVYCLHIKAQAVSLIELGSSDIISSSVKKLKSCIDEKGECTKYQTILYDKLIRPMKLQEIAQLNIVPSLFISNLPFELLLDEDDKLLLETYDIVYQYSSTLKLNINKQKSKSKEILVMAPMFGDEKTQISPEEAFEITRSNMQLYLPNSLEEVSAITDIFNVRPFVKSEATVNRFLSNARDAKIIHLATHGIVDHKNPNRSKLLFTSEDSAQVVSSLQADEIVGLDLHAELVTLSACNTGTGKIQEGEGVSSLGRAFAYAGCPNQVISLWAVNDISTSKLMALFYKNLKEGMTKPQAIRKAKIEYLKTSPIALKHPHYWAGFVYYGNDVSISRDYSMNTKTVLLCFMSLCLIISTILWKAKFF